MKAVLFWCLAVSHSCLRGVEFQFCKIVLKVMLAQLCECTYPPLNYTFNISEDRNFCSR